MRKFCMLPLASLLPCLGRSLLNPRQERPHIRFRAILRPWTFCELWQAGASWADSGEQHESACKVQ